MTPAQDEMYSKGGEYKCQCGRKNWVETTMIIAPAQQTAKLQRQLDIAKKGLEFIIRKEYFGRDDDLKEVNELLMTIRVIAQEALAEIEGEK